MAAMAGAMALALSVPSSSMAIACLVNRVVIVRGIPRHIVLTRTFIRRKSSAARAQEFFFRGELSSTISAQVSQLTKMAAERAAPTHHIIDSRRP
ncbi:exported protein of unknown function [Serratia sp. Tan611]|nr:exported protein of unknown function [Serratia sp. Tan611]